jgi:nucleoside-diphosphate-sugar epimerase
VRDTAKAHVVALENPHAKGRYLTVSPDKFSWKKVRLDSPISVLLLAFDLIRPRFPDKHIPKGDAEYNLQETAAVDVRKAESDLGFGWTSLEKSFGDMGEQFYRLKDAGFPE